MPVVLRITSKRTFTTRRIIQHIVSVPSSGQSITILSIFRQVRSAETFLEFEDREFANIVLKSQQQKPFPFDITLSSNITHPIQSSLGIWLSEGASIHLRLDFDRRDKEDIVSGQLVSSEPIQSFSTVHQLLPLRSNQDVSPEDLDRVMAGDRKEVFEAGDYQKVVLSRMIYLIWLDNKSNLLGSENQSMGTKHCPKNEAEGLMACRRMQKRIFHRSSQYRSRQIYERQPCGPPTPSISSVEC